MFVKCVISSIINKTNEVMKLYEKKYIAYMQRLVIVRPVTIMLQVLKYGQEDESSDIAGDRSCSTVTEDENLCRVSDVLIRVEVSILLGIASNRKAKVGVCSSNAVS